VTDFEIDPPLEITVINRWPAHRTPDGGRTIGTQSGAQATREAELHLKTVELTHIPARVKKSFAILRKCARGTAMSE
jgi:hypothetical protein